MLTEMVEGFRGYERVELAEKSPGCGGPGVLWVAIERMFAIYERDTF